MVQFSENCDLAISFRDLERIHASTSARQNIELYRHGRLGNILVIDKEVQHVEKWQCLYHEPLIHLPAAFVREIKTVLILGGGSLFAAAEVLRYPSLERCILVDHDPIVLEVMGRYYGHARRVLDDKRFEYVAQDAIEYLRQTTSTFDLVVNDCFNCVDRSEINNFSIFDLMTDRITANGICSDLIYRHVFEREHCNRALRLLRSKNSFGLSLISVPEYPGVLHILAFWGRAPISQSLCTPLNETQMAWRNGVSKSGLEFFNPEFLAFHLYIPPFISRLLTTSLDEGPTEAKFF